MRLSTESTQLCRVTVLPVYTIYNVILPLLNFSVWNLKNAFAKCGFLRELFEVLGVRVVVECEVCLE